MWILLPQFKGEFFMWHFLESYILHVEKYLLTVRMKVSSFITIKAFKVSNYFLGICLAHISWDSIQEIEHMADKVVEMVDLEIKFRDQKEKNGGDGAGFN